MSVMAFVNLLRSEMVKRGIYAFNPALADKPKAENILNKASIFMGLSF